jgi:hypothetical protein
MANRKIIKCFEKEGTLHDVLVVGKGKNPTLYFVKKNKKNPSLKKEADIKDYTFKFTLKELKRLEDEIHEIRVLVRKAQGVVVDLDLVKYHDDGTFTCSYSQLNK